MENLTFIAEADDDGKRLDVFLAERDAGLTRSAAQKLLEGGGVAVNGVVRPKKTPLKRGDMVTVALPGPISAEILAEDIPLDVLYEDAHLIVINKPQGMVVHPAAGHTGGTAVNALLYRCGAELSGINGVLRPGIVHRIDRDTSGVIVAAKTDAAHQGLAAQLAAHSMKRVYKALVNNVMKNDEYTVDKPIGRSASDRKKMAVCAKGGRNAVTRIRVLERFAGHTLVEARLETGRTHQIRVHAAHIGYPVTGDPVYGRGEASLCGVRLNGQTLHAETLGFKHPVTGEWAEFAAEMPECFREVLDKLKNH